MSYELQVYSLSPLRPTPRELLARIGESGLAARLRDVPGARAQPDDTAWSKLLLGAVDVEGGFLVEDSPELERMKEQFRADRAEGEAIPDPVLDASRLFLLELDDESPAGADHQASFVIAAWALAGLTEGIVFDPQEEFFADAESFWAILMDEETDDGDSADMSDMDEDPSSTPAIGLRVLQGGCCGEDHAPTNIGSHAPTAADAGGAADQQDGDEEAP